MGRQDVFVTRNPFLILPRPPGALLGALLGSGKMDLHETVSQSSVWAENYGNPHYFGTRNPFLILPRPPGALLGAFWPKTEWCRALLEHFWSTLGALGSS